MKVKICLTVTGANTYMVFRGKTGIQENIFRFLAILETSHYFVYVINEKILKLVAIGRGNFPLGNMVELLFFPSKMIN